MGDPPEQIANPALADLEILLSDVRLAVTGTPVLDRPFSHVGGTGAGGAWTGTEADRIARDRLDPLAAELNAALRRMEEVVEETIEATPDQIDDPNQPASSAV